MAWLALNTAEGRLQMVIAEDGAEESRAADPGTTRAALPLMRFAGHWHAPSQGAELLAPALADVCDRLHMNIGDIRRIAVVRGPGSFTGIRLALATASGLARATGAAIGGIDYLPLLAASALDALAPALAGPVLTGSASTEPTLPRPAQTGPVQTGRALLFALTHARRDLLHMQGFTAENGRPTALTGILVLSPFEAVERIAALRIASTTSCPVSLPNPSGSLNPVSPPGFQNPAGASGDTVPRQGGTEKDNGATAPPPILLFGSGLTRNRACIDEAIQAHGLAHAVPLPEAYDHPSDTALLRAAAIAEYSGCDIAPLYVRPADAEENLDRIAAGLGLDPEQARTRLLDLTGQR